MMASCLSGEEDPGRQWWGVMDLAATTSIAFKLYYGTLAKTSKIYRMYSHVLMYHIATKTINNNTALVSGKLPVWPDEFWSMCPTAVLHLRYFTLEWRGTCNKTLCSSSSTGHDFFPHCDKTCGENWYSIVSLGIPSPQSQMLTKHGQTNN